MSTKKLPKGIRQKHGSYEARAVVNGIKINMYGKDLESLIENFEKAKNQARCNIDYNKNEITLNEWFEEWFDQVKAKKVKETSIYPMKRSFQRTFGFFLGNEKVKDIKPLDVQRAINAMQDSGIAVSTIRDTLGRMRECMEFAVANQMIQANPCIVIEVPWECKNSKKEIALTQEEQNALLVEAESTWYKELFYFMCLTGVRVGELGALKWEDIDFNKKVIRIRHSLSCSYSQGVKREIIVAPKTVNSTREIPFIGEMEEILLSQKKKQEKLRVELGDRWRGKGELDNLVFTTSMGSPCSRYIVDKEVKKIIKRLREKEATAAVMENRMPNEIRDFHPHTLRHTFATRCFEKGMEPKVVQALMGHSSITVTMNIYTHVLENKMADELNKFGTAKTVEELKTSISIPEITAHSNR